MLEITSLRKSYSGFNFGPIDLSVGDEVLSVLGPSGSGKSTFLSLIAGIVRPDTGTISLNGQSLVSRPIEERQTGLVFQDGALFPHMTARENIDYATANQGRTEELVEMLEIQKVLDRRPKSLSGGERQRVALARTLAADPEMLLLDEPLSSLDMPIRRRLRDELHNLFKSLEIPVIYVTHDQRAATLLGDRIAVLREGCIDQVGSSATILNSPETKFVARFTGCENIFDAKIVHRHQDLVSVQVGDITLQTKTKYAVGTDVSVCVRPARVRLSPTSKDVNMSRENTLTGTIHQRLNEGDEYRVIIKVDGADIKLTAYVRPSLFEQLPVDPESKILASISPDAIHVIG